MLAEEQVCSNMIPEIMKIKSCDTTENFHTLVNQAFDNPMDQVIMEFLRGNEHNLDNLTDDKNYCNKEAGDFTKGSDISEGKIENKFLPENTMDIIDEKEHSRLNSEVFEKTVGSVSEDLAKGDILECMTIASSPDEHLISDLLEEVSGDLDKNEILIPKGHDFGQVHVTRNPTSIIVGANHKFSVCSRYLSAPLASCHDLCKSGKYFLEDPKRCISGAIGGVRSLMRRTGDSISLSKIETKKKALLRHSSLPVTTVKNCSLMHSQKMNPSKHRRTKTSWLELETEKEIGSQRRVTKEKAKEPINNNVTSKMTTTYQKSSNMKTRIHKCLQSIARSKNQSNSKEANIKISVNVPEETLNMIKASNEKNLAKEASAVTLSIKSLRNTKTAKAPTSNSSSPRKPETLKRFSTVKARLHNNIKNSSCLKNPNNSEETKITDKKLSKMASMPTSSNKGPYMVEPNFEKKLLRKSSLSAASNKRLPNTPRASHASKTKGLKNRQNVIKIDLLSSLSTPESIYEPQGENQQHLDTIKTIKIGATTADGDSSWVVNFRRGTEVALQVEDTSRERLRFRQGRIVGDDQNATKDEAGVICLKTRELTDNGHDTNPEAQKVLLRHQEGADKKDSVDLNGVIEETASKLVKTNKGKVKALVGAFETLISLHDRKPWLATLSCLSH